MKLIIRHLTRGLLYKNSFRMIPSLVGTIIPFFWQLVNLYGVLPAILIISGVFQLLIVSLAALIYPCLLFKISFIYMYCLDALLMAADGLCWLFLSFSVYLRGGFRMV